MFDLVIDRKARILEDGRAPPRVQTTTRMISSIDVSPIATLIMPSLRSGIMPCCFAVSAMSLLD